MSLFEIIQTSCFLLLIALLWRAIKKSESGNQEIFIEALPERLPKIKLGKKYQVLVGVEALKLSYVDSHETFAIPRVVMIMDIDEITGMLYMIKVDAELNAACPNSFREAWVHPSQFSALVLYEEPVGIMI